MKRWFANKFLSGEISDLVDLAVKQAIAHNADYDPRGEGFRPYAAGGVGSERRDLTPVAQDMMLELAYYMYDTSGLTKRFVGDQKNFVLGAGIEFSVSNDEDGRAYDILESFWHDPMNRMDVRLEKRIEFLGLLGEQCWPVQVDPRTGKVWVSYIDPSNISDVSTLQGWPEIIGQVKIKGENGQADKSLEAVRVQMDASQPNYGRLAGECFFFSINNPPNSPRGRSDLIHLFDFLENYESGLYDELERGRQVKAFIWDVLMQGASEAEIKEFIQNNPTPKPGSVRVHNERITWKAESPQLHATDAKAMYDLFKTYLAGCQNIPDSWLGSGGKAYQNEAELMGDPTYKNLGSRQRYVKYMIEYVLQFVIDQAVVAGTLKDDPANPKKVEAIMPELSAHDTQRVVDSLLKLSQALALAEANGWITKETATEAYAKMIGELGVEVDVAEEIKAVAEQIPPEYAENEEKISAVAQEVAARMAMDGRLK
jgi:hypothetical protein